MSKVDRTLLITGASTGIGEACALEFDRREFRVFAGVRSTSDGEQIRARASSRLIPLLLDVTNPKQIAASAGTVAANVGSAGLFGLVNNAGIVVAGPVELVPMDDLRHQMEVNVIGQVAVLQAMLPLVRAARGRIVNMSSISGRVAAPCMGPYAASKHALEAISDCLRAEMRPFGVCVSVVEPGSIQTPIWGKALAWADRMREIMTPAAEAVYGEEIRTMRQSYEALAAGAMPVARVVRAVVHALTARRPRTRYPIGLQTRAASFWFPLLSDRARDWCIRVALGLNRKNPL